jgi:hypothetical protein
MAGRVKYRTSRRKFLLLRRADQGEGVELLLVGAVA